MPFDIDFSRLSEAEYASVKEGKVELNTDLAHAYKSCVFQFPSVKFKVLAGSSFFDASFPWAETLRPQESRIELKKSGDSTGKTKKSYFCQEDRNTSETGTFVFQF